MKRNEKEWKGIKTERKRKETGMNRNHIQEWPEMTAKTTENDRRISLRFSHFEEWIPRKFPDFPRIFLENSPIFSDFPQFSPIFSEILRLFS